jgi:hypothetical protein
MADSISAPFNGRTMPPVSLACNRCDAPIQIADLDQGLAVRVDGELVCQQCVDSLPGEAQVKINQLRAMRGLSATTYTVSMARHPALHLFSFTTAGNITVHRRVVRSDGRFDAPTLPAGGAPVTAAPAPVPAPAPEAPTPAVAALAAPPRSGRPVAVAALALALCLGGGAAVVLHHGGSSASGPTAPPAPPGPVAPVKTRFDYSVDPLQGWIQARDDRDCPELVRQAITLELKQRRTQQLDEAELAFKDGRSADAVRLATSLSLPDDIAFRDLRSREDELRKRVADARTLSLLKAETPPAPRPTPPPQLAATTPAGPARPAPAVPPASEAAAAAGECLKFPGKDLVLEDSAQWKRVHNDLHLNVDAASVRRSILVEGGSYQVWIQVLNRSHDSAIQAVIGGLRVKPIEVKSGNRGLWMELLNDGKPGFALPNGSCTLEFNASGRGLDFVQIMVYDSSLPAPDQAEHLHPHPPRWGATPPSDAPVANATLSWKPHFVQAVKDAQVHALALDGSVYLPAGWPGGIQGFWRSAKVAVRKRHAMTLDFHDCSSDKGGIALLLHPGRIDRKQLLVTVYDQGGKSVVLPPFQFNGSGDWEIFTITAMGDLEGAQIGSVLLEDDNGADFPPEEGFILGKAATCINQAPSAATLALRPPALVRDEHRQKNLLKLLEAIGRFRKHPLAKATDPAKLRLLVGASLGAEWRAAAKGQLDALLPGRLPAVLTQELVFQDAWLDSLTRGQGQAALLDPQGQHVVMVMSAGTELKAGMTPGQAIDSFWKKRLEQLINNGYLPVAVLGPSLVESDRRGDADKLWGDLEDFIAKQLPGLPMIDLRGTMVGPGGELGSEAQDFAAAMLADGYGEFIYWLRRSGGGK